jgi:hypothetical protein
MVKGIADVTFRVPNNAEGRGFIKLARKYINRERYSTVNARPRGPRSQFDYDTPRKGCKGFGVYLDESKVVRDERFSRDRELHKDHEREIFRVTHTAHEDHKREMASLDEQWINLRNALTQTLHNWQIGALVAFLGGLALGMTAVGMSYTM